MTLGDEKTCEEKGCKEEVVCGKENGGSSDEEPPAIFPLYTTPLRRLPSLSHRDQFPAFRRFQAPQLGMRSQI